MDYQTKKNYGKEMILDYTGQANAHSDCPKCNGLSSMRCVFGASYFYHCEKCGHVFALSDKRPLEEERPILLKVNFKPLHRTCFFRSNTSTRERYDKLTTIRKDGE